MRRGNSLFQAVKKLVGGDRNTWAEIPGESGESAQSLDSLAKALQRREDELLRVNRALKTISECNQILVRAEEETSLLHEICQILVTIGGFRMAWIGYAEQDEARTVRPVAWAGYEEGYLEKLGITWAEGERGKGPTGTAIRIGKVCKANNIPADPAYAPWRSDAVLRGYSASIAIPLLDVDRAFGALNIYAEEPEAFQDQEERLLQELANDVAYSLLTLRTRAARRQAEHALGESEERYRSTLDNMLEGCQIIGYDWRYLYVNDAAAEHGRRAKQVLLGSKMTEAYPGIENSAMFASIRRCMEQRIPDHLENEFTYPDGTRGWFELGIQPVREGVFILSVDITERKRAEKAQAAVYRISQATVSTRSMDELYFSIHQVLSELMPVENFYIALYDPSTDLLSFPYYVDQYDEPFPPQKLGHGLTEYVLRTQSPLLASPQVFQELLQQGEVDLEGTDSVDWVGVPLKTDERVIGVMVAQSYTEGIRYNEKDMHLLEFVSTQVALAIERKRAEEQIHENALRAQTLADISRVIVDASMDCQYIMDVVVKSLSEVLGDACVIALTSEEGEWLQPAAYHHPDPEASRCLQDLLASSSVRVGEGTSGRVARTGQPVLIAELLPDQVDAAILPEYRAYSERYGVYSILIVPLRAQGQVIGTLRVTRDQPGRSYTQADQIFLQEIGDRAALAITNARLYQQEQARSQELAAINSLSSALRQVLSTEEMLPVVLREVHQMLRSDSEMLILRDQSNGYLKIVQAEGQLASNTGLVFPSGQGVSGIVIDSRQPYVTDDYIEEPKRLPGLDHADEIGPAVFVPLQSEVETLGVLMVARHRGDSAQPFSPTDVRMMTIIGELVGNSLRRALLFEETQRRLSRVQALRKIDLSITNSLDLRVSIDVILEQIIAQTGVDAACVLLYDLRLQTFNFAAGRGFCTDALQYTSLHLGEGYAGRAAEEGQILHISDLRNRKTDFLRSPAFAAEGFVAYYAIPLITKGGVKGVLEIFHRAPLKPDQEWLDFLETLAGQAAIALDNASLFADLQRSNQDLILAYDATIEGWSHALDLRDKETEGHTQRVTRQTLCLSKAMGMSEAELVQVTRGALLHDIGKMGIPDHILLKQGPLSQEEWVLMRKHPVYAYEMLAPISYLEPALVIPYYHHEKWDGSGYPHGLKGEEIPLAARIFAVVDVWDALTSDRPYRQAWGKEKALEYIRDQSGKHFDPSVTQAFFSLLKDLELQPDHWDKDPLQFC